MQLEIVFSMVLLHLMYKNTYSPIKYLLTLFTDENYNFGYLKQNPLLAIESLGKYIALKTIVCNSQLFDHYLSANISITVHNRSYKKETICERNNCEIDYKCMYDYTQMGFYIVDYTYCPLK